MHHRAIPIATIHQKAGNRADGYVDDLMALAVRTDETYAWFDRASLKEISRKYPPISKDRVAIDPAEMAVQPMQRPWPELVTKANQLKPGMRIGDAMDVLASIGGGGMSAAGWRAAVIQLSGVSPKGCYGSRIAWLSARYATEKAECPRP